jgi:hypothetical protein
MDHGLINFSHLVLTQSDTFRLLVVLPVTTLLTTFAYTFAKTAGPIVARHWLKQPPSRKARKRA